MSKIQNTFSSLKAQDRSALIPYITAGDPQPGVTVPVMHAMVEAGADIIELGVPFSDPMADGPVIQKACERALAHGVSLRNVLGMVSEFRQTNTETPVVLMGYLNPIEAMGDDVFIKAAVSAGVDGVLVVDLPPEEAPELSTKLKSAGLDPIFLLAPTSSKERISSVAALAAGYVYYVSLKGVTGSAALDVNDVASKLSIIRELTDLPLGVGFGIKDAITAAAVAEVADAVVVGSVLVSKMADLAGDQAGTESSIAELLSEMRAAMDKTAVAS